jgi:hypothetical protein
VVPVVVPNGGNAQTKRLVEFASDVFELANQRPDLELRELVDDLVADLRTTEED